MNDLIIEDFFNTDYVDSASYDNLRKISSYIDGQKNCNRKIVHTILQKNINKKTKVSRLQSSVSETTEYLHGEDGVGKVIVNMAQNYTGTNNLPLLQRNGNFGNRHSPTPSASRYIYTQKENYLDNLFNKYDYHVLKEQYFEGIKIEPKFYIPIVPLLLMNGSIGISTGFSQKILPRDPKKIYKEIIKVAKGNKKLENVDIGKPYWEGFTGDIKNDPEIPNKWYIYGRVNVENKSTIIVEELPISYDLKKYISILDVLVDKNVIVNYKDLSEDDRFKFKIKCKREFVDKNDELNILKKLKLIDKVTENLTTIDENNRIRLYNNINEIFIDYYKIRLEYYDRRKKYRIKDMERELSILESKYIFVSSVVEGKIVINDKSKKDIVTQLQSFEKIVKVDDNYDYLLRMPIYSLSKEKLKKIRDEIKELKKLYKDYLKKKLEDIWVDDLEELKNKI